jgi:hypothetical protein
MSTAEMTTRKWRGRLANPTGLAVADCKPHVISGSAGNRYARNRLSMSEDRPSYESGSGQALADGGAEQGFTRIRRERKHAPMRTVMLVLLSVTTATAALASDSTAQKVDQLFGAFAKAGSPGCSVGVIRNGNFIYKKSFGYASLELGVPLTPESVFYVGSISKQFTAASVVLAAEQGYLSLDDDVRKYLPELPDYGHPVTLRQMLHQTSGFRDLFDLIGLAGGNPTEIGSPGDIHKRSCGRDSASLTLAETAGSFIKKSQEKRGPSTREMAEI